MDKNNSLDEQSHNFERYKIEQEFAKSIDREIEVDLDRNFESEDEGDVSYDGAHFVLSESAIDEALTEVMDEDAAPQKKSTMLGKLRQRMLRGRANGSTPQG